MSKSIIWGGLINLLILYNVIWSTKTKNFNSLTNAGAFVYDNKLILNLWTIINIKKCSILSIVVNKYVYLIIFNKENPPHVYHLIENIGKKSTPHSF